ncbi:MAG: hypothetical protein MET45_21040 [Nostoc sp. LLA-1]|nr:hypothetical protein [Cyanocohniella sp. LLY]
MKKISVLQECSNRICDFENRPRSSVEIVDFNKFGANNRDYDAAYSQELNTIGILPQYLKSVSSYEMFGTLIHESMHGYQVHAIDNPGFHKNTTQVNEWKEGYKNYISPNQDFHQYKSNSLEVHSSVHGSQFKNILQREHQIQNSLQQLETEANNLRHIEQSQTPKKIVINQISDNEFQIRDQLSGEPKTYKINLPKGKTLEEVIQSNPDLISRINNLEKGQEQTIRLNKTPESNHSLSGDDQKVDKNSKENNHQKERKNLDFER